MELRDLRVGKVYRVDAGTVGGLHRLVEVPEGRSFVLMRDAGEMNAPNIKVLPHQIVREAMRDELDELARNRVGQERTAGKAMSKEDGGKPVRGETKLLVARIQAATMVMMYLGDLQEAKAQMTDQQLELLAAAQEFLIRGFQQDAPAGTAPIKTGE